MADRPPFSSVLTPGELSPEALAAHARARGTVPDEEPQTIQPRLVQPRAGLDAHIGEESPTMMGLEDPATISAVAPIPSDQMPSPLGDDPTEDPPTAIAPAPVPGAARPDDDDEVPTYAGPMTDALLDARAMMEAAERAPASVPGARNPRPVRAKKMTLLGIAPHTDYDSPPSSSRAPGVAPASDAMPTAARVPRPGAAAPMRAGYGPDVPGASAPMRAAQPVEPVPPTMMARTQERPGSSSPMVAARAFDAAPDTPRRIETETVEAPRPADIYVDVDPSAPDAAATREMSLPESLAHDALAAEPVGPPSEEFRRNQTMRMPPPPGGFKQPAPASEPNLRLAPPPAFAAEPALRATIPPPTRAAGVSRAWMVLALLATAVACAAVAWIVIERVHRVEPGPPLTSVQNAPMGAQPSASAATTASAAEPPANAPTTSALPPSTATAGAAPPMPDISDLPGLGADGGATTAPATSASAEPKPAPAAATPPTVAPAPKPAVAPAPKPAVAPAPKPVFKPVPKPKPPAWKPATPPPTPKNPYS